MNKVITINLNGNAYPLEEDGYEALRAYLENAARRLEGNPDKEEIITDIEQAIADKFRALLGSNKTVVTTKEVASVIAAMGPVEDASTEEGSSDLGGKRTTGASSTTSSTERRTQGEADAPRRLYRIYPDGARLSGVCNGLGAYFNIDATLFRLLFVLLCFFWGAGIWIYILMVLFIPLAETPAEKSAASGATATAQEFIRRAKAGYYEGMKTFHDKQAHREWKRKFKREMRGWKHNFQREMQEHAHLWRQPWVHAPYPVGLGFAWSMLRLLKLVCLLLLVFPIWSLVTKGSVFGLPLPAGVPGWLWIIAFILIYKVVTLPLKVMRRAYYYHGAPYGGGWFPLAGLWGMMLWVGTLVFLVWLADCYLPHAHEVLQNMPHHIHEAVHALKVWWAAQ